MMTMMKTVVTMTMTMWSMGIHSYGPHGNVAAVNLGIVVRTHPQASELSNTLVILGIAATREQPVRGKY